MVLASVPMSMAFKSLRPEVFTASIDLKRGVFSSMHLPKCLETPKSKRTRAF